MSRMHALQPGEQRCVRLAIDSRLDHVELLGRAVRSLCTTVGVGVREAAQVELALVEAVNNVIRHAYHGRPGHVVEVTFTITHASLELEVLDDGEPMTRGRIAQLEFDPRDVPNLPEGGMGLLIMHSVMEQVTFSRHEERNRLVMSRRLAA